MSVLARVNARRLTLLVTVAALALACAETPDPNARITLSADAGTLPDPDDFAGVVGDPSRVGVHVFLEKLCGSIDCHGQASRPFRLYSVNGLREPDAGLVPGLGQETPEEIVDNYGSLVGLQPEETAHVVIGDYLPTVLLIVQKPTGMVSHKGGTKFSVTSDPAACLTSWLTAGTLVSGQPATFEEQACANAAQLP